MPTTQKKKGDLLRGDLILVGDIPSGAYSPPIPESDVSNLVTDLAGKAALVHTHVLADITDAGTAASHAATDFDSSGAAAAAQAASLQIASNLSDLANAPTARTNLGLGTSATKNVGTIAGTVAAGDDSRLSDARTPTAHASTHSTGNSDPITPANIGAANATHTHAESDVTNLTTDLAAKQPLDATLTALAGLDSVAGLVEETAADTFTKRAIGVGATTSIPTRADADARFAAIVHTHAEADVTNLVTDLAAKVPTTRNISNGFGITGGGALSADRTLAVALTTAEAFISATTSISAATYADITGASITLAAGTWLILAFANFSAANLNAMLHLAITDSANTVIVEGSQGVPASGTASVAQDGNVSLSAIVTPAGSTTYKLRGARGNTTLTGTVIVMNGTGTATTNNLTDGSNKGTSIRAIRIA